MVACVFQPNNTFDRRYRVIVDHRSLIKYLKLEHMGKNIIATLLYSYTSLVQREPLR